MSPGAVIDGAPGNTDTQVATLLSSPLSINGVPARRAQAPKISGSLAPHASSRMFKGPSTGKPPAKQFDHHLSEEAKSRGGSTLKNAVKFLKDPSVISLGGGLPSSDYFPFESMSITVPQPPGFSPAETHETGQTLVAGKNDYRDGKSLYDIHIALNYGQSTGSAQLLRFVTEHTEIVHDPPYEDWACSLTVGTTSSFDMVLRMLCSRGDSILSEEYTFVSAVETATPMGIKTIGVGVDEQGMKADALDRIVSTWDEKARGCTKPRVVYTVPSGQNPTGATQSEQRRRDIYAVCQKHDLLVIEDEPYFFLQMDPYNSDPNAPEPEQATSHEAFFKALVPSYLSMDVDGRVLRLDSFSKVIAPGSRVGWLTATEQFIERFNRHGEVSTQNPSGISQLALFKLLDEGWGHAGYIDWLRWIRGQYSHRRNMVVRACEEFLPTEVASWRPPMAGMFHWISVDWRKHPRASKRAKATITTNGEANGGANGEANGTQKKKEQEKEKVVTMSAETQTMLQLEDEIFLAAVSEGTLMSKGSWFRAEQDGGTDMFFRATFAAASEENIREAIKRFGTALRKSFEIEA